MSQIASFADLGLSQSLLRAIADSGYDQPTPIQAQAIPLVLQGGDLRAAAQTGTGKTASFTLPILQLLSSRPRNTKPGQPRCLILTPTRELAAQVEESVRTYGRHLPLKSMVMFGGVGMMPQINALKRPLDILVATPGRLLDHCGEKTLDLSRVEIFVLDEADRMLDMGFIRDIRRILPLLPAVRQNLMFSATFSNEIRELSDGLLKNPASVEVARRNAASELVEQSVHLVPKDHKRDMLAHLIRTRSWNQVLVFTRTKHGANRLAEKLEKDGIPAAAIHGNKSQSARTRALARFKDGTIPVLVATDIAARGLDIDQLPQVVNFELPNVAEDYVHRIGRTGRAGSSGAALSLVDKEEMHLLADIERLLKRKIERTTVEGFVPPPRSAQTSESDDRPEGFQRRDGRGAQRERDPQRNVKKHHRHTPSHTHPHGDAPQRNESQRRDDGRPRQGQQPHRPGQSQRQGQPQRQGPSRRQDEGRQQQQPRDGQQQRREQNGGERMSEAARHQAQPQPALFRPTGARRGGR